jgi:hypothetical protein
MSTNYWPNGPISMSELFDGRMERFNIREHLNSEVTECQRCLTDGSNFVWVLRDDAGSVDALKRYSLNAASTILSAIGQVFNTAFSSESDDGRAFESDEARYTWFDEQARGDFERLLEAISTTHVTENSEAMFERVIMAGADMPYDQRMLIPLPAQGERKDRLLH